MNWKQLKYYCLLRIGSCIVLLTMAIQLKSQEIRLTASFIDSLYKDEKTQKDESSKRTAFNLRNIYEFNQAKNRLKQTDTITVYHTNQIYTAKYKDQLLPLNNRTIEVKGLIRVYANGGHDPNLISSITSLDEDHQHAIDINYSERHGEFVIEETNLLNELPYGAYKKEAWSGFLIEKGNYMQVDSISRDTIFIYDPFTYEEIIEITERPRSAIKCGIWTSRNEDGELEDIKEQSCEEIAGRN